MIKVDATIKGIRNMGRIVKAETKRQKKAFSTAARVEAFRLVRDLKSQIRKGVVGGRRFAPLSYLARRTKSGKSGSWNPRRMRPDRPLRRFALGVAYNMKRKDPLDIRIGFTGPRSSKSWRRLAKKHQEGFEHGMAPWYRQRFARVGGMLGKRAAGRRFLFIRRDKKRFRTPARPILEPFWASEKAEAIKNIRRNYIRKLRGKRI